MEGKDDQYAEETVFVKSWEQGQSFLYKTEPYDMHLASIAEAPNSFLSVGWAYSRIQASQQYDQIRRVTRHSITLCLAPHNVITCEEAALRDFPRNLCYFELVE